MARPRKRDSGNPLWVKTRKSDRPPGMSVLPPIADLHRLHAQVRFVPKAEIAIDQTALSLVAISARREDAVACGHRGEQHEQGGSGQSPRFTERASQPESISAPFRLSFLKGCQRQAEPDLLWLIPAYRSVQDCLPHGSHSRIPIRKMRMRG